MFIILFFTLLILLIFNLGGWFFYLQAKGFLDEELGRRLTSIAVTTAMQISPELTASIRERNISTDQSFNLKEYLTTINEENNLESISIIDKDNNYIILDTGSEHLEGEKYQCLDIEDAAKILDVSCGKSSCSKLYRKGKEMFKTGFAPLKDTSGEVIAIIGVDASPEFLRALLRSKHILIILGIISAVFSIFYVIIMLAVIQGLFSAQEAIFRAEKFISLRQFGAGIAHQIKNPLVIILLATERLKKRYLPQDSQDELFDTISNTVQRIHKTIDDFVSYAKGGPIKIESNNLSLLFDEVITKVSSDMERLNIRINKHIEPEVIELYFDKQQMEEAFLNLIQNAMEAMPDGGVIAIKAYSYLTKDKKQFAAITVSDTGKGINPMDQKRLFEPFFTTKDQGYGVGMLVVKGIIEKHMGTIEVKSRLNEGTTFTILLPKEQKHEDISG